MLSKYSFPKLKSLKTFLKDETKIPKMPRNTNTVIHNITYGVAVVVVVVVAVVVILLRLKNL